VKPRLKTTNAIRDVDIHPAVASLLKAFVGERESGFLFASRAGKPLSSSNIIRRHLRPALKELNYVNPHTGTHRAGVFGLGCTLAALAPGYWWFAAALAVIGAATLTLTNGTNSIMQLSTEPAMRGRVMALRVGIALGGTPIGAPIIGWVANHFGPRWALGLGAGAGFTAALVAVYVLARRREPLLAQ